MSEARKSQSGEKRTEGTDSGPASLPASVGQRPRSLFRFVYTNNPFYTISAVWVLFGLWVSFGGEVETYKASALLGGLVAYILLLAGMAYLLIRFGSVWEDVRSLLLLVVLLLLAISVTFDEPLARRPLLGTACYSAGLVLAIAVSEGLLRGLRISLPRLFRIPYYLVLVLFFLYPIALSPLITTAGNPLLNWALPGVTSWAGAERPALQWALFGFSPVAGLVFLTLLPAIRRGANYVRDNGTPWHWPGYPWVLFAVLAFAVCVRSYYLCVSLHFVRGSATIFGTYFLVPFLLAVSVLLLEIGLVGRNRKVVAVALAVPVGLLILAVTPPRADLVYTTFLAMFMGSSGGSPLYLTLVAAAAFYAYATFRRVRFAYGALATSIAALSVIGPNTVDAATLGDPRGGPILAVAALEIVVAIERRSSLRCMIAACFLLVGTALQLEVQWPTVRTGQVPLHLLLLMLDAALLIGAVFHDAFSRLVQYFGAVLLLMVCFLTTWCDPELLGGMPPAVLVFYPVLAAGVAVGYGYLIGDRGFFACALAGLLNWLAVAGWHVYDRLRQYVCGLDHIAWGLLFFVIAALISLAKAGLVRRGTAWVSRKFRPACPPAQSRSGG